MVVFGAGVGASVTSDATGKPAPTATWKGLLRSGAAAVVQAGLGDTAWSAIVESLIGFDDLDMLLSAAEQIGGRLGAPKGGDFAGWLTEAIGGLPRHNPDILHALLDLNAPLLTTNYDDLLEQEIGLPAVTWRDEAQASRVLRGDERAVLHLHGYWRQPETVVLGMRGYEAILAQAPVQALLRSMFVDHSVLFVGCGAGLEDPNFGALLRWPAAPCRGCLTVTIGCAGSRIWPI